MGKCRKQIAFDLIADRESPILNYFTDLSSAYHKLELSLKNNGFPIHEQGSVYSSANAMTQEEAYINLSCVCKEIPWLGECVNAVSITNIGIQHDITDKVREECDKIIEKELLQEQETDSVTGEDAIDIDNDNEIEM